MQFRVTFSPVGRRTFLENHAWISAEAPVYEERWTEGMLITFDSLRTMPERHAAFATRASFVPPIRRTAFERHLIYFRVYVEEARVEILLVRHSARRAPTARDFRP